MPSKKLKKYLDDNHIEYVTIRHSPAYTAERIAALSHISGKELAKTVMIKVDDIISMAVLPASFRIDFEQLRDDLPGKKVELATEAEFKSFFPDCEVGAMPPFGNLYNMKVYVAKTLAEDVEIAFNAGTHTELIQMAFGDFKRLVQPIMMPFSVVAMT